MTGEQGQHGPGEHRVLVVRCPAWDVSGQPGGRARDQGPGPRPREFERVVSAIGEFCPRIEVLRPGICAMRAGGPASYFGSEAGLANRLAEAVARLGFGCGVGVADGMFAALLAARDSLRPGSEPVVIVPPGGTPAYLAPRSVTVLGEPELASLLTRLGVETLGGFAALPAAEVSSRFGPPGLLAHRVARGLDPRPLAARPPSDDMSVQVEFDPPAERSERVVFAAKSLAGQMHAKLAARGLTCVRVRVQASCAGGQEITRLWRHDGLLTDLAVAERVRWQLDGWQDGGPADGQDDTAAGGICSLRLIPDQLVRAQGRQLGLWGDAVAGDGGIGPPGQHRRVARAAIRVQAMLGHDAVLQPMLAGGRGPADQVLLVPFGELPPPARPADRPWPGRIPSPAPTTVYPAPRPARVTGGSGEPVTVTGRGLVSADPARLSVDDGPLLAVTAWTGPWPVTERWWDPARACRKARFQLVTVDGSAWLAIVTDGRWLIEARYD